MEMVAGISRTEMTGAPSGGGYWSEERGRMVRGTTRREGLMVTEEREVDEEEEDARGEDPPELEVE